MQKKVVVDEMDVVKGEDYILVDDVLKSLQELANYHRHQLKTTIIGITGSNGKTTTKELIKSVLSKKYNTFATVGNLNNHIGVPLTLLSLDNSAEIAVVEMGANNPGEIKFLCNIAEPNIGLITNVGKAHLEGFGSFEGVKKAKGELYKFIEDRQGVLFVNKSNAHLMGLVKNKAKTIFYGWEDDCTIRAKVLNKSPNLSFSCIVNEKLEKIDAKLIGGYNLENALAAIAIGAYFDVDNSKITEAINNYTPTNNRSQLVISENNKILFDAYNANPTSMRVALENFLVLEEKSKVLILGEMKELGEDSEIEHGAILSFIRENNFNSVYLIGNNYKPLLKDDDDFIWYSNVEILLDKIKNKPLNSSFILVKGSRSNRLELLQKVL